MTAAAATSATPTQAYRIYALSILILIYMLNFLDRQIIGILAPRLIEEFGLTDGQFGLLGGIAFASVYSTLAIPVAWLADRFSRVWIMTIALATWSGFTALCGTATSFTQLFLYRMGVGVGEAGGTPPAYSLVADYFPKSQRSRALAAYSFGIPLGTAAGTLVGGVLAHYYGWRVAFIVVGLLGVLVAPLLRMTVRDPVRGGMDRATPAAEVPPPAEVPAPVAPEKAPTFGSVIRTVFPKPSFWLLAFGAASSSVCGYGVAGWLPSFFVRSFGLTLYQTSWYYAGIALIGGLAGIWLGGALGDKLGQKSKGAFALLPAVAFLISAPCFILAMNSGWLIEQILPGGGTQAQALTVAFLIFLIPTGLNLCWLGPIVASVQHLAPAPMRSTVSALFLLVNNLLGIAVGFYYFGFMSDLLRPTFGDESLRWAIYTGMGFYMLAAALFIAASRTLSKDWVD